MTGPAAEGGVLRSALTAPRDGIMTRDVGVITGELELATRCVGGQVTAWLRYAGADEWYRLPQADCRLADERDHEAVHGVLVAVLDCSGRST